MCHPQNGLQRMLDWYGLLSSMKILLSLQKEEERCYEIGNDYQFHHGGHFIN